MTSDETTLHLLCGKIAAGKSTLAAQLSARPGAILVSEDHWLARLYPGQQETLADYLRNSARLRDAIAPHLVALLRAGVSIVLDFPANTSASRQWMRSLFETAGSAHQLHYLDLPDEACKARLHGRNAAGRHEFTVDDATFDLFTSHFAPPAPEEGFNVVVHRI